MFRLEKLESVQGLVHGFSSLEDGNMSFLWGEENEVLRNRGDYLQKLSVDPKKCAVMSVWDEGVIEEATCDTPMGIGKHESTKADALITREKGVALFLLTADCLPIILYDPVVKVIALVHAGWKSTDAKLCKRVVEMLGKRCESNPVNVIVGIGPGIRKESYVFTKNTREYSNEWSPFLSYVPGGGVAVDIVGYNMKQLIDAGIPRGNMEVSDIDTGEDKQFFSHHRSQRTGEKEGRFATVVTMKEMEIINNWST